MLNLPQLTHLPIRTHLMLIMVSIAFALILGGGIAATLYNTYTLEKRLFDDAETFSTVLASDLTKVLLVGSVSDASDLSHKLHSFPSLLHADLFDLNNNLILHFDRSQHSHRPIDLPEDHFYFLKNDTFTYTDAIYYDNVATGSIFYEISSLNRKQHQIGFLQILLALIPFSFVLVYAASSYLQRFFSHPLKQLANSIHDITTSSDFNSRLEFSIKDKSEFAHLGHNFNALLTKTSHSLETVRSQQEKLEIITSFDILTRLPNQILFSDRFNQAVVQSNRTHNQLAICFLDVDNFKPINDTYGQQIGDLLLIQIARRITKTIGEENTASRHGGDEFALLLRDIESSYQCEQLLDEIRYVLAMPYTINKVMYSLNVSIGYTLYPIDNSNLDSLLRHATQAMYQAKSAGKDQSYLFNVLDDQNLIQTQIQLLEIKQALTNNEFHLYYQPKVNMKTGQVFGVEALIRWFHPEKGLIPPLNFLPLIEGTDLELQVGNWVVNEAIQQLDHWKRQKITLEISINVSSHQLLSPDFLGYLNQLLNKYPYVEANKIQLEILESSVLSDIAAISESIERCQDELGIHFALDDFGTGYSSLAHLRSLPADTIKIDQSFVRDMLSDSDDLALIEGIISLARIFNRHVIAEGVESIEHGVELMRVGCNFAQGNCISPPMPASNVAPWLQKYTPYEAWSLFVK